MKRMIGLALLAALTVLAGYGIFHFFDRIPPPEFALTGGTILVYEVDETAPDAEEWDQGRLQQAILQRLDPDKVLGIRVAAAGKNRVEIRIPHRARDTKQVDQVKDLLHLMGKLEFRMLANQRDDKDAFEVMMAWFDDQGLPEADRKMRQDELERRAKLGQPPPGPEFKGNRSFAWSTGHANGWATYSWIELDRSARADYGLNRDSKPTDRWQAAADARAKGAPFVFDAGRFLLFSRPCIDLSLVPDEREAKEFDYFLLARDPPPEKQVSGKHLQSITAGEDAQQRPALQFRLDKTGGDLFYELTTANRPSDEFFRRHLAIVLDDRIVSAPSINDAIRSDGQISGPNWTEDNLNTLIRVLRSGTLPVRLKKRPVQEQTVPPT